MYECGEFALSVWNVMAETQQALYRTGAFQWIGINNLSYNLRCCLLLFSLAPATYPLHIYMPTHSCIHDAYVHCIPSPHIHTHALTYIWHVRPLYTRSTHTYPHTHVYMTRTSIVYPLHTYIPTHSRIHDTYVHCIPAPHIHTHTHSHDQIHKPTYFEILHYTKLLHSDWTCLLLFVFACR